MVHTFILKTLAFYLVAGFTVIPLVHETGHALFARLGGLKVYFFGVGDHKPLLKIRLGSAFFFWGRQRSMAGVSCIDEGTGGRAMVAALLGGLVAEAVVVAVLGILALATTLGGSVWFLAFLLAWGVHLAYGLLPVRTSFGGMTDMLSLLKFGKPEGPSGASTEHLVGRLRSQNYLLALAEDLGHDLAAARIREKMGKISALIKSGGGVGEVPLDDAEAGFPAWVVVVRWLSLLTLFAAVGFMGYLVYLVLRKPWALYDALSFWYYSLYLYYIMLAGLIVRIILRKKRAVGGGGIVLFFLVILVSVYVMEVPSRERGFWTKVYFHAETGLPALWVRPDGKGIYAGFDDDGDGRADRFVWEVIDREKSTRLEKIDDNADGVFDRTRVTPIPKAEMQDLEKRAMSPKEHGPGKSSTD